MYFVRWWIKVKGRYVFLVFTELPCLGCIVRFRMRNRETLGNRPNQALNSEHLDLCDADLTGAVTSVTAPKKYHLLLPVTLESVANVSIPFTLHYVCTLSTEPRPYNNKEPQFNSFTNLLTEKNAHVMDKNQ